MSSLADSRGCDGSYAKPFEIALMRVLCLRLSLPLSTSTITLKELLPDCNGSIKEESVAFNRADCEWVEVDKLSKEDVKRERAHGTMVCSKLSNVGAVEGFWYLLGADGKPFDKISTWEANLHKRAQDDFGLAVGTYAAAFFSTSTSFEVRSSLAMPKKAVWCLSDDALRQRT